MMMMKTPLPAMDRTKGVKLVTTVVRLLPDILEPTPLVVIPLLAFRAAQAGIQLLPQVIPDLQQGIQDQTQVMALPQRAKERVMVDNQLIEVRQDTRKPVAVNIQVQGLAKTPESLATKSTDPHRVKIREGGKIPILLHNLSHNGLVRNCSSQFQIVLRLTQAHHWAKYVGEAD
jgi:hypothetical protein